MLKSSTHAETNDDKILSLSNYEILLVLQNTSHSNTVQVHLLHTLYSNKILGVAMYYTNSSELSHLLLPVSYTHLYIIQPRYKDVSVYIARVLALHYLEKSLSNYVVYIFAPSSLLTSLKRLKHL